MKRAIALLLALIMAVSLVSLTACGEKKDDDKKDVPDEPLVGTWVWAASDRYVFNEDGTGYHAYGPDDKSPLKFKYVDNGETLTITWIFENVDAGVPEVTADYRYSIKGKEISIEGNDNWGPSGDFTTYTKE